MLFGVQSFAAMRCLATFVAVCAAGVLSVQGQLASGSSKAAEQPKSIRKPDFTISNAITNGSGLIAYSSNELRLAVGLKRTLNIYELRGRDPSNARLTRSLTLDSPIQAITFHNSNVLVSLSQNRGVTTWEVVSGSLIHNLFLNFETFNVSAFAPNDLPLLATGSLNHVGLWNYVSGELLSTFDTTDSNVSTLAFTPDGKLLVAGTHKGVVRVFDVATRKVTRTIDLDSPIRALSASTKYLVVGYADGTLAELGFRDQATTREVSGHNDVVTAIAFSPHGERFASGSKDGTIKIWDAESLKLQTLPNGSAAAIFSIAFGADGKTLISSTTNEITGWRLPESP
jgi:WD40 repeat protein